VAKDGRTWRVGTSAELAWIDDGATVGLTINAGIPLLFEAYATVVLPADHDEIDRHDRAVLAVLSGHSAGQPWWLGYLDTGGDDVVFRDAPMVSIFHGWGYVLVEAGPDQAATWRRRSGPPGFQWKVLPDLIFPADRSWLFSKLWDDDWSCLGGSARLIEEFLRHPDLQTRQVTPDEDATPPGHTAF
jgi:hypothetical protein